MDDPTQEGLGIHAKDNHIKMKMRGIVCYTNTRVPSEEQLRECDRIVLTSSKGWDPHNVTFKISAVETWHPEPTYGELLQQTTKIHLSPVHISGVTASKSTKNTTSLQRSQQWNVGLNTAESTRRNTTQDYVTQAQRPLSRRYRTQSSRDMYTFLDEVWYTDTVHGRVLSYSSCLYAQIFTNRSMDFIYVVPLRNNRALAMLYALQKFVQEFGRPRSINSVSSFISCVSIGKLGDTRVTELSRQFVNWKEDGNSICIRKEYRIGSRIKHWYILVKF